jgi:hypothetical protein
MTREILAHIIDLLLVPLRKAAAAAAAATDKRRLAIRLRTSLFLRKADNWSITTVEPSQRSQHGGVIFSAE